MTDAVTAARPQPATLLPPVRGRRDVLGGVGHRRRAAAPAGVRPGGARAARRSRGGRRRRCRARRRRPRVDAGRPEERAAGAGFRAPMRWDGDVCRVVDQRRLPDVLVDIEVRGGGDGVAAIRDEAIVGSPAQAQLGAVTLALAAGKLRTHRGRSPGGRRSAAPPTRCATCGPGPRPCSRPWTGCWSWRTGWGSRPTATRSPPRCAPRPRRSSRRRPRRTARWSRTRSACSTGSRGDGEAPLRVLTHRQHGRDGRRPVRDGAVGDHRRASRRSPGPRAGRRDAARLRGVARSRPGSCPRPACRMRCHGRGRARPDRGGRGRRGAGRRRPDRANGDVIAIAGTYPLALAASAAGIPFIVCVASIAVDARPRRRRRRRARGGPARAGPRRGRHARGARGNPDPQPGPGPDAGLPGHRDRDRARRAPAAVRASIAAVAPGAGGGRVPEAAGAPSTPVPPAAPAPSAAEAVG